MKCKHPYEDMYDEFLPRIEQLEEQIKNLYNCLKSEIKDIWMELNNINNHIVFNLNK